MIILLGNFVTPVGVSSFDKFSVYDLRSQITDVALWAILNSGAAKSCFVLLPPTDEAIGVYATTSSYLKWSLTMSIIDDVRMAVWWAGDDSSRSGAHGTQHVAYLATFLKGVSGLQLSGGAYNGSIGMTELDIKENAHVKFRDNVNAIWYGVALKYVSGYSYPSGWSPDHMRRTYGHVGSTASLTYEGKCISLREMTYENVAQILRAQFSLAPDLQEALAIEDLLRSENYDTVHSLYHFYLAQGVVKDSQLFANCNSQIAEQDKFLQAGGLFNFSGHFRRMGAANNCDIWVIQADGSLRECDKLIRRKHYPEGNKRWYKVSPDELVLKWRCGLFKRAYETTTCEIAHQPTSDCTEAQLLTAKKIEEELSKSSYNFQVKFFAPDDESPIMPTEVARFSTENSTGEKPFNSPFADYFKER